MKTGKKYIQVFIESEADLPKDGDYIIMTKSQNVHKPEMWYRESGANDKYWLNHIDWYLLPIEAEEKDELREELKIAFNAGKTYQAVFDREWHSGKWNEEIDFKEWYNKYLKSR